MRDEQLLSGSRSDTDPADTDPADTDPADTALLDVLRRCVVTVVPEIAPADVTPDCTLAELGCNSIDRAEVVIMAMEQVGVTVPVSEFGKDQFGKDQFGKDRDIRSIIALLRKYG